MKPPVAYTHLPAKEFAVEEEHGHRTHPRSWPWLVVGAGLLLFWLCSWWLRVPFSATVTQFMLLVAINWLLVAMLVMTVPSVVVNLGFTENVT